MPAVPPGANTQLTNQNSTLPWVEIIEQPSSKSTRFRYECEGRFAGSILGRNATNEQKTFPAIKVHNHNGACVVVVSLVTADDDKPKPHPHTLVGPECRQGVCTKKVKQNLDHIQFPNLGIQCKKKAELKDALTMRQQIRVDPFRTGFDHMEKPQLNNINLMMVKLCFQVFLPDESGKYQKAVTPVCSQPIVDKKSAGELSIHSYLPETCSTAGKEEMILLTGKLPKADELEVRFYEGRTEKPDWEGFGTFTQKDIHQSVAVTIKIPEYTNAMSRHKQQVMLELRKRNNPEERSTPRRFFYISPESKNRHRPNKREQGDDTSYVQNKKIKADPGFPNGNEDIQQAPTVLDHISMDTNSSGGSAFNSSSYRQPQSMYTSQQQLPPQQQMYPLYQQQPIQQQPIQQQPIQQQPIQQQPIQQQPIQQQQMQQMQQQPMQHQPLQQQPQQGMQYAAMQPPNQQLPFTTMIDNQGQEVMRVRASDLNIYRNDDSGKVFMAPGPTAPNPHAPQVELGEDSFREVEMSIDEILRMARENPESDIYIPSNLSEHINAMLNPSINILEGEVIQTAAESEEPHSTSLTRELKSLPQAT